MYIIIIIASLLPNTRIVPKLEKKLDQLVEQHDSILKQLSNNQFSPSELAIASKTLSDLTTTKSLYDDWKKSTSDLNELHDLLTSQEQEEGMLELAKEEFDEIMTRINDIEKNLIFELVPKDIADDASAILEIRAGTGGDEASLFSNDIARMYERFAQLQRWKWEVLSKSEDVAGKGLKVIFVLFYL